jgi:hypothetical protein
MATDPEINKYPPNPNPGKVGPQPPPPEPTVEAPQLIPEKPLRRHDLENHDDDDELFEQLKGLRKTSFLNLDSE